MQGTHIKLMDTLHPVQQLVACLARVVTPPPKLAIWQEPDPTSHEMQHLHVFYRV